jgi:hypothetical protein
MSTEEIYEPTTNFNFNKLTLTAPTIVSGGSYFIKFLMNGNPLYIQPPKCITKQGIIKSGKKMYCDLMMTNIHEQFIQWLENLENYSQDCIFTNREKWFETQLEKTDIENSFSSPVKTYKSGKFYIIRTNVPTRLGKCVLKIYDENENDIDIEQIQDTTNVITILEFQGIKCSARSFQIEIEIKQMMVLKPSNLFERCAIQPNKADLAKPADLGKIEAEPESEPESNITTILEESQPATHLEELSNMEAEVEVEAEAENPDTYISSNIMTEIDFNLEELPETDTVQLKKRNEVYYEMYREAKKKAKIARRLALSSYLEAKRIKNTYMLDEIDDDSDSGPDESDEEDGEEDGQEISQEISQEIGQ